MVAERDRVGAGGEELLADRLGDAEPAGGVLAVDDDEIEPPARAQARQAVDQRRAAGAADDVADEQQPHQPRPLRVDPLALGEDEIEPFVVRLVRRDVDLRDRIGDADGANRAGGAQTLQRPVVAAGAVADAMAAPIEGGERHEQQVGLDQRGRFAGLRHAQCAARQRLAGPPQAEGERRRAAVSDRQRGGEAMRLQGGDERPGVRLVADRREGGDDSRPPAPRPFEADCGEPRGQRGAGRRIDGAAAVERLTAQDRLAIARLRIGCGKRHGRDRIADPLKREARSREGRWTEIPGAYVSRWAPCAQAHGRG